MIWLLACASIKHDGLLPAQVSLVVEANDGQVYSLLLDLHRNLRDQIDLRVSEGYRLYDGQHIWQVQPSGAGLSLTELVSEQQVLLPVPTDASVELRAMSRDAVWVQSDRLYRCGFSDRRCAPAQDIDVLPLTHPGPMLGFAVGLSAGKISLTLPVDEGREGQILFEDVRRIIGIHWIRDIDPRTVPMAERTFRGRALMWAPSRAVVADGRLDDWADAAPLVVTNSWQLESGGPLWQGARDSSFSLAAAALDERHLCFAGRIRDDQPQDDDQLILHLGEQRWVVPLHTPSTLLQTRAEWFSQTWELCVEATLDPTLPFAATLVDADADGTTILASAPLRSGQPDGLLRIGAPPEG